MGFRFFFLNKRQWRLNQRFDRRQRNAQNKQETNKQQAATGGHGGGPIPFL
jgi:hypothetical protein